VTSIHKGIRAGASIGRSVARKFEVVVIGAGPGGYPAAIRLAQLGKRVLLVERDRLGGECLNYGCIPSKALIHTANLVHAIERAADRGVETGPVKVDMVRLQQWKGTVVQRLTSGIGQLCKGNGVEVVSGQASFTGADRVQIQKSDGSEEVTFVDAIIATGGRPSDLPAIHFDGKKILSTKEALELPRVPQNLAVVGGGISGLEIGTFYAKLGSRVVVVEIMDQILPGTDPEAVRVVARNLQKLGVEIHTKSQARWREDRGQGVVDIVTPEGLIARRADVLLLTVGRRPNTDDLHADRAGVEFGPRGHIKVDRQLRTSNPHIFAIGDVIGPPFLAHKATKEGLTAAEVIAGHPVELDYRALPSAIFTDPEIATVGLQEPEAVAQGKRVRIGRVPFAAIGRALTTGEYDGFVKLIADPETKILLGATVVGPDASDLISELTLAIEMGATVTDIALTVHPHPTLPEGIMESAEAALGQAIHILNR
jgi:dihydrolipoamide dehydrogenase